MTHETGPDRRPHLLDLSDAALAEWLAEAGEPAFRAKQILNWVYEQNASSFAEMTNLPQTFRDRLADAFDLFVGEIVAHQVATDRTEKLLIEYPRRDGGPSERVECVLMRETSRRTVCISTQVGCAMGCVFCASGLLGVKRNLSTGEIVEQVLRLKALLKETERVPRLTNVVVMGIGEPMANLGALLPALERLTGTPGLALSPRRITVSTVGLPDQMRTFADVGQPFRLAVSLHAPNDELRTELVPVNKSIGVDAILAASDDYFARTGRRVSFEYVLLGGVNDHPHLARQLAKILKDRTAHVNLIPMNDVSELPFQPPDAPRTDEFEAILTRAGIETTVRKRKGADIDAACGQLRLSNELVPLSGPEA